MNKKSRMSQQQTEPKLEVISNKAKAMAATDPEVVSAITSEVA